MTDAAFFNELWIACYKTQIDGYPLGHPKRTDFQPIVPFKRNEDGTYNRAGTLEMAGYSFTDEQKALLLAEA
jgi:hypothetical protein